MDGFSNMTLLAIDWAAVGIKAGQFILSFSILVVLHELGHFLPAKWFKCRVEKFYLFFNPWFSLLKKKIGETEYGIGWVPFGGYVKISGMIDESMDKEQMKSACATLGIPEQAGLAAADHHARRRYGECYSWAFSSLSMILWIWGEEYLPAKNLKYGVYADSLGRKMGMQDGDNIISGER